MEPEKLGSAWEIEIDKLIDPKIPCLETKDKYYPHIPRAWWCKAQSNSYEKGTRGDKAWVQRDKQAHAVIGHSLSGEILEHLRRVNNAKELLGST